MLPMRMAIADRAKQHCAKYGYPHDAMSFEYGTAIGLLDCTFDNIARAREALREGNVSGAQMFLDMCEDPRKETK